MRVNPFTSMQGGVGDMVHSGGPAMIDGLMSQDSAIIESAKERRNGAVAKKNEFQNLGSLLDRLKSTTDSMTLPGSLRKLAVDSSDPDILAGEVSGLAEPGSYQIEVAALARSDKHLEVGFPDKDKTQVGFGFLRVGTHEDMREVTIEPGATLQDVALRINDTVSTVRASVINTGAKDDPFRLLVTSKESGEQGIIEIDPDTTFTEFKQQVKGQDVAVKFEGVDVRRSTNGLNDLIEGVNLKALKAAPGSSVTVNVRPDVDKTTDGVRDFIKQYNEIQSFTRKQTVIDSSTGKAGPLSGDGAVRQVSRSLQSSLASVNLTGVGITTNAKTGELNLDEAKLKEALAKDYEGVLKIFSSSESGPGLAAKMSESIRSLQDRTSGPVATRMKGIEQRIRAQDLDITRKEERMASRRAQMERTFASLDAKLASFESERQTLGQRFGQ